MALTKTGFKTNFGLNLWGRETVERGEQKEKRREKEEEERKKRRGAKIKPTRYGTTNLEYGSLVLFG